MPVAIKVLVDIHISVFIKIANIIRDPHSCVLAS